MARLNGSQRIAISGTTAVSAQLTIGATYAISATADCFIRQGASNVVATADQAGSFPLKAGAILDTIRPSGADNQYIAVIGTTGALYIALLEGV